MLASDATRVDATSWHLTQHTPVTPVLAWGFALPPRSPPCCTRTATHTAPSSRRARNVASDATPRLWAAVMNACLSVCGPTGLVIPARRATFRTIRPAPCRSSRRPSPVRKTGPSQRSPVARSIARAVRGASGMVTTTLPPLRVIVRVRWSQSPAPGSYTS